MKCVDFLSNAKERVLIERQSLVTDEIGGSTNTWTAVGTYWAWVKPMSTYKRNINAQLRGETSHEIVIRYQSVLKDVKDTSSYRLTLDSRIHTIVGLENLDSYLKNYGTVYQEFTTNENAVESDG